MYFLVACLAIPLISIMLYVSFRMHGRVVEFFFEDSIRSVTVLVYNRSKVRCLLFQTKGIKGTEYVSFLPKTPHASLARDMLILNKNRIVRGNTIWDKKTRKLAIMLGLYEIASHGYKKEYSDDRKPYKDYALNRLCYPTEAISLQGTPYEVLGLKPTASPNEIHVRYRDLVKVFHPDRSPDTDDEAMKRINAAYSKLKEGMT